MKRKTIIILISSILILVTVITSCAKIGNQSPQQSQSDDDSQTQNEQGKIAELEAKILTLIQNQELSETERKKEIAALTAELEKLKDTENTNKDEQNNASKESESDTDATPSNTFKYTLDGDRAIITEIGTSAESVNIPSSIDGYPVYSIGSEALTSKTVKTVVISSGIEKLDWFAFRNCISLSSISIPSSVTSIGYGAFDNVSKGFTIKCQKNSFAHQYAESYGLTYDIT